MTLDALLQSLQRTTIRTILNISNPPPDKQGDDQVISVGIVVPITLIIIFLIGVFACLYWHSRKDHARNNTASDKSVNTSFGRFTRSFTSRNTSMMDHVRESTRSTMPLRDSMKDRVHVTALPFSDSQKFRFYWDRDNWKLYPEENQPGPQVNTTRISVLRQQLSPIDETEATRPNESFDVTQGYDVTAQAPFSPYHLTWLTPAGRNRSEESEVSTISKPPRGQSLQTTNTTMSTESCSACVKYGKSISSPYFPNHNTPTTECELGADQDSSQAFKLQSELTTNTNNSRFTSYPSSPRSSASLRSSVANSLTTSNLDTGVDASLVTSYQEPACPPSSMQSDQNPSADQSELHSTNPASERPSQTESDFSGGVPSLPSSILYYHQKMTAENVVASGAIPYFSVSGINCSMGSSVESSENNYVDNTSMLPNVGSSNTSGNPTGGSVMFTSTMPASMDLSNQIPIEPTQHSAEDLSKIVNELSSIRVCSNEPMSIFKNTHDNMTVFDAPEGGSACAETEEGRERGVQATCITTTDGNFQQSMTELFRSWSVTGELDFSSSSVEVYQKEEPRGPSGEKSIGARADNFIDLKMLPSAGKRFTFDVPLLTDKIYWV